MCEAWSPLFTYRAFAGPNDFTCMGRLLFRLDMIPSAHKGLLKMRSAVQSRRPLAVRLNSYSSKSNWAGRVRTLAKQ